MITPITIGIMAKVMTGTGIGIVIMTTTGITIGMGGMSTGILTITRGGTETSALVAMTSILIIGDIIGIATMDTGIPGGPGMRTGDIIQTGFTGEGTFAKTAIFFSDSVIR
jgi:hypothetical protein